MVDLSKLSADLRGRIENIMATKVEDGGGKDAKNIDSQKEYQELSKLLSGDAKVTGKQKEIVEGMLTDYEDKFMVRDEVKQRVADIVKYGDEKHADDHAEIRDLRNYKKTKGLSNEEKAYIQRVIDGKKVVQAEDVNKATKTDGAVEAPNEKEPIAEEKSNEKNVPKETNAVPDETNEASPNHKKTNPPKRGGVPKDDFSPEDKFPPKEKPIPGPGKMQPVMPVPVPVPVPVSTTVTNKNSNNVKQGGIRSVNINGSGNTVIINGEAKTEKPEKTPKSDRSEETKPNEKPNKLTQRELESLANQIFDAVDGLGTKDEQLQNALNQITKDNIIELLETYNAKHPDMFDAVLDDLSGVDFDDAVAMFSNALYNRAGKDPKLNGFVQNIKGELKNGRSQDLIVRNLYEMVKFIKNKEANA